MSVIEIPLTQGHVALINEVHQQLVAPYTWNAFVCRKGVYARAFIYAPLGGKAILMHRLITGAAVGMQVDHINHNGKDNRYPENLRVCTPTQNNANQRLRNDNTSGYKGVRWHRSISKWGAQIAGQHIGVFDDPWEAAQAYNEAAIALWGEFAFINERRLTPQEIADLRDTRLRLTARTKRPLRINNTSGYKGVSWHEKTGKWVAQIGVNGRRQHLGLFETAWEAAQAYNVAARAAWGDAAYINVRHPEPAALVTA